MPKKRATHETEENDEPQIDDQDPDEMEAEPDSHPKDMEEAAVVGRLFYYVFHVMINMILLLYDNDLRDQILNLELGWPMFYILLTVLSTYLFHTAKNRPGYLRHEKPSTELEYFVSEMHDPEQGKRNKSSRQTLTLEIQESKETMPTASSVLSTSPSGVPEPSVFRDVDSESPQEPFKASTKTKAPSDILARLKEGYIQPRTVSSPGIDVETQNLGGVAEDSALIENQAQAGQAEAGQQDVSIADNVSQMSQIPPNKRFCSKCNIVQNYRTKHCKNCNECVAKFDHHCFFIGGCVGELNHRKFLLMLIFMQLQYILVCRYLWSGLEVNSDSYEENHPNDPRKYTKEYGAFFMSAVIAFLAAGLVAMLLGYHSYLCLANETTWENLSAIKIDYLNVYPTGFRPFDKGLVYNLKTFFFHNNQLRDWELPEIKETWKKPKGDTIWRNQYYSCC